jgi:hypothetical protein
MSDLKSMMDGIFLDAEDESLPKSEKAICEKLLLTISIKEWLFNDEQRKLARNMLKRLEGDRRRRCPTSTEQPGRLSTDTFRQADEGSSEVREELKDGIFSVPVPRDELPEYYEQIEHPMDYGIMRQKLERDEYHSAQAMQKDFILVMQNCLKFNARGSEIVKEARQQALMRPVMLRNAAMKQKIFLAEDGSALEVYSDGEGDKDDGSPKKKRKGGKKSGESKGNEEGGEITARIPKKSAKVRGRSRVYL